MQKLNVDMLRDKNNHNAGGGGGGAPVIFL